MTPLEASEVNAFLEPYGVRIKGRPPTAPYEFDEDDQQLTPEDRLMYLASVRIRLRKKEEAILNSKPPARLSQEDQDLASAFGAAAYWLQQQLELDERMLKIQRKEEHRGPQET